MISGEVRLRKPDPAIYELAAAKLGLPVHCCVFVDDIEANLPPAQTLGMATVHHVENAKTIPELERLLEISLQ